MDQRIASRLTPLDGSYPACERAFAEFRIYTDSLSSRGISATLGLAPTSFQDAGEIKTNSMGLSHRVKRTGWFFSSEGKVPSKDVRDHLDWLLDELQKASRGIQELQEQDGVKMTVYCLWWSTAGEGGPTLWPEQMEQLSRLNLEVSFDIYFYGEDESD